MATNLQLVALKKVFAAAMDAGVLFPQAQACEAMVESAWMTTLLAERYCNLFGMKQHTHPVFGTINLPTREFVNGAVVNENADFVVYPNLAACFRDRMTTLERLASVYPHYDAALDASTPEEFLEQVSQTWSTDPNRATECIGILHAHDELFV